MISALQEQVELSLQALPHFAHLTDGEAAVVVATLSGAAVWTGIAVVLTWHLAAALARRAARAAVTVYRRWHMLE